MKVLALTLLGALVHAVAVTSTFDDQKLAQVEQAADGLEVFNDLATNVAQATGTEAVAADGSSNFFGAGCGGCWGG